MPCFVAILALLAPRIVLLVVALFTSYIGRAYETLIWPVLGFFFMPLTTLAYAYAINEASAVRGYYFFLVLLAALIDLGVIGGGASRRRKKLP